MQQEQIEIRKQRGYEIAKTSRIEKTDKGWKVPSQSGSGFYMVKSNGFGAECNCPDHELRNCKCKHIWAVELIVTKEIDTHKARRYQGGYYCPHYLGYIFRTSDVRGRTDN